MEITVIIFTTLLACLHDQSKSYFFGGLLLWSVILTQITGKSPPKKPGFIGLPAYKTWLLSSQSEQSEKFSKSLDWLERSRPSKKATFAL